MVSLYNKSGGVRSIAKLLNMPDAESRKVFVQTAIQTDSETMLFTEMIRMWVNSWTVPDELVFLSGTS